MAWLGVVCGPQPACALSGFGVAACATIGTRPAVARGANEGWWLMDEPISNDAEAPGVIFSETLLLPRSLVRYSGIFYIIDYQLPLFESIQNKLK